MIIYDSADIYINGATCLRDKITRIDAIIVALEDAALKGAAQGNISDYSLNDGQTQIRTSHIITIVSLFVLFQIPPSTIISKS